MGIPNRLRTAVCCDLLGPLAPAPPRTASCPAPRYCDPPAQITADHATASLAERICSRFDRYGAFLTQLRQHLYGAVYADAQPLVGAVAAGHSPTARDFFRATPYFEEVKRLLEEKETREQEM